MTGSIHATDDDHTLLRDYAQFRDESAFAAIVARYGPMVAATARRQARDVHRADDVAQAVFLILARRASSIDGPLGPWLHRTTMLAARNAMRVDARRRRHEREAIVQRPHHEPTPIDADVLSAVDAALDRLSTRDREVIGLRFFESLGIAEIATRLGLNTETAKKRLARALDRLRHALRGRDAAAVSAAMAALMVPTEQTFALAPTPAAQAIAKGTMTTMKYAPMAKLGAITTVVGAVAGGIAFAAVNAVPATTPTAPTVAASPASRPAATIESSWNDLAAEEPAPSIALLHLAKHPAEFLAFAADKFVPLTLTHEQLTPLLADLGSADEARWHAAREKLGYFDPRLAMDLKTLVDATTEQPLRNRLIALLSNRDARELAGERIELNASPEGGIFYVRRGDRYPISWRVDSTVAQLNESKTLGREIPTWTRLALGIHLLKRMESPTARAILERMTGGHPDAQPTRLAKQALAAPANPPSAEDDWTALQSLDSSAADALLRLAQRPSELIAICRRELTPLKLSPNQLAGLLGDLAGDDRSRADAARRRLDYLDPRLAADLETLIESVADEPVTQHRLVEVLGNLPANSIRADRRISLRHVGEGFNFRLQLPDGDASSFAAEHRVDALTTRRAPKPSWTRAVRAIVLLESIATPEACAVVDAMATGDLRALPTRVAKALVAARP